MEPKLTRVLLVEDDAKLSEALAQGLDESGYEALLAPDGETGFFLFSEKSPSLVILDLNLPKRDGLDVLQAIRKLDHKIPVLILSARDTLEDRVTGLERGADDYLVKPFAFSELLARLRALLRRYQSTTALDLRIDDLEIDPLSRTVHRAGQNIKLTPREYDILELLVRNAGRIVSRQTIADEVWRVQRATPLDNVIDVHIMRLRRKINDSGTHPLIHTVRGMGFKIDAAPDDFVPNAVP